jgi:hypothetical protein
MNPAKLIAEFLEARLPDTGDSTDTLADRVAMDKMPHSWENTTSAIMVRIQVGAEHPTAQSANRWTVAIHCFGGTAELADAWAVYKRVATAFRAPAWSGTEGEIRDVTHISASGYEEADTGWPVVVALYEVQTVNV